MSNTYTKTTIKLKLKPKLKISKLDMLRVPLKEVKLLKSTLGRRSLYVPHVRFGLPREYRIDLYRNSDKSNRKHSPTTNGVLCKP